VRYLLRFVALVASFAGLSSPLAANPLVFVAYLNNAIMVADMGSLNKQPAFPTIWVDVRFARPKLIGRKWIQLTKVLYEFDCINQQLHPTYSSWEDDKGGKGSAPVTAPFAPIVPDERTPVLYRLGDALAHI
jgi:hypothetical protein